MNTGQSILTIGAMLLLSVLILRINSTLFYSGQVVSTSKLSMVAMSLAQSRLEQITKSKCFDEGTKQYAATNFNCLTLPSKLGPESGENSPADYDDIDDYNGCSFTDTVQIDPNLPRTLNNLEIFNEICSVVYVTTNAPNTAVNTKTWNKKITVNITNKIMKDTISVSTIFSYWNF